MPPVRVAFRAKDAETLAAITAELESLHGKEPEGAELVDDPVPRTQAVDPQVAMVGIALLTGAAGGAGTKLGEVVMTWLIQRVRLIVRRRKARVTMRVAGVEVTVDEQTDPEVLGAQLGAALEQGRPVGQSDGLVDQPVE